MIDLEHERLLSFSEAAATLPGRPNTCTLHRWRLRGCRGVKLETALVGGRRVTSREALQRFSDRTIAAATGEQSAGRTPRQRERRIAAAERELDKAGI